jgi:hypothetical protein
MRIFVKVLFGQSPNYKNLFEKNPSDKFLREYEPNALRMGPYDHMNVIWQQPCERFD